MDTSNGTLKLCTPFGDVVIVAICKTMEKVHRLLEANPNWGVIDEADGFIFIADNNDKGSKS